MEREREREREKEWLEQIQYPRWIFQQMVGKNPSHTHTARERARNGMEESQFVEYPWIFELCPELKTKRQNGLCPNVKYSIFWLSMRWSDVCWVNTFVFKFRYRPWNNVCVFSGRERDWQRLLPSEFEEMSPVPVAIFDSETDWSLLTAPISSRYSSFWYVERKVFCRFECKCRKNEKA